MQSHYNYVFDDITNTYNFTTKNDILYRVAFIVDETFSTISGEEISNIFQLVVEKATDGLEPYDAKVLKPLRILSSDFSIKSKTLWFMFAQTMTMKKLNKDTKYLIDGIQNQPTNPLS